MSLWTWFVLNINKFKTKKFYLLNDCFLFAGDYERSKRYGERSFSEAIAVSDTVWQLNAKVLVAHSQTKLREYREAEQTFDEALTLAKDQSRFCSKQKYFQFALCLNFYQKQF